MGEEPVVLGQVIESGWWGEEPTASLFKKKKNNFLFYIDV